MTENSGEVERIVKQDHAFHRRGNCQSLNVYKIGSLLISCSQFSDRTGIFMESELQMNFSAFKTMTFAQKLLALQVSNFFEAFIRRYAVLYMVTSCFGFELSLLL